MRFFKKKEKKTPAFQYNLLKFKHQPAYNLTLGFHRAWFVSPEVSFLTWNCYCGPFLSSKVALTIIGILGFPCVNSTFRDVTRDSLTLCMSALNKVVVLQTWRSFCFDPIFIPNHHVIIWIEIYQMPRVKKAENRS